VADQVKEIMRANPNAVGVNDNWNESVKVLRLDLDQDKLRALGVTSAGGAPHDRHRAVGHDGRPVPRSNRLIDIVVRQPLEERSTMSVLNTRTCRRRPARPVPLSQLARIEFVWEPGVVWREGREWAIMVQSDVVDGIQGPTVSARSTTSWTPAGEAAGRLPHQAGRRGRRQLGRRKPRSRPTCRWCCSSCSPC
jgi:multidrug efflux pump